MSVLRRSCLAVNNHPCLQGHAGLMTAIVVDVDIARIGVLALMGSGSEVASSWSPQNLYEGNDKT